MFQTVPYAGRSRIRHRSLTVPLRVVAQPGTRRSARLSHVYMRAVKHNWTHGGDVATRATADPWERYARELGVRLQRLRIAKGLSQERLAVAADISSFTYRKLEKGESNPGTPANPRLRTLVALAEVLEIDLAELLPASLPNVAIGR
jgi:DNA-binding XRE family transcriptional regulator